VPTEASGEIPRSTVTGTSRAGEITTSALVALERARNFDKVGQEEACMTEIGNAKQQLGVQ